MRKVIGVIFLLIQAVMIIAARFTEARYFCWAPHDAQNEYQLSVEVNGRPLNAEEIRKRYRISPCGLDPRSIAHIKNILRQYEKIYGQNDQTRIRLVYRKNGIAQAPWQWP